MIPKNPCKEIKLMVPLTSNEFQWMLGWVDSDVFHESNVYDYIEDIVWQLAGNHSFPMNNDGKPLTMIYLCEDWLPDIKAYKPSDHWKTLNKIIDKLLNALEKWRE